MGLGGWCARVIRDRTRSSSFHAVPRSAKGMKHEQVSTCQYLLDWHQQSTNTAKHASPATVVYCTSLWWQPGAASVIHVRMPRVCSQGQVGSARAEQQAAHKLVINTGQACGSSAAVLLWSGMNTPQHARIMRSLPLQAVDSHLVNNALWRRQHGRAQGHKPVDARAVKVQ